MRLHFPAPEGTGFQEIVGPDDAPSGELQFGLMSLTAGEHLSREEEGREAVLVILAGTCSVSLAGGQTWRDLGERADVFSGLPTAVYLPPNTPYRVQTERGVEIGVCMAPADAQDEAYIVQPAEVRSRIVGRDSWRREVRDMVDASRPASRLVVGETINDPGSWSSYPPHKHDVADPPRQVRLQEIYHYRLQPAGGFGLQRIYSPERGMDVALTVQHGDTVLIPFGYHPVVGAGGYRLYYLWMLAGEGRDLRPYEDPMHKAVGSTTPSKTAT